MQKVLIATTNNGKIQELSRLLKDLSVQLVSLKDAGIHVDVEETGTTYEENAELKAKFYANLSGLPAISDDGGLEIAALGGAPGIKSRRWLGYHATDEELIAHMKKVAKELPEQNRNARFYTVVSFALPTGEVWSSEGAVEGIIAREPLLELVQGYPYRSFFYLPQVEKFYHENQLTQEEQKAYNHRYKAIEQLKPIIEKVLNIKSSNNKLLDA